jgi:hypothetical protein
MERQGKEEWYKEKQLKQNHLVHIIILASLVS